MEVLTISMAKNKFGIFEQGMDEKSPFLFFMPCNDNFYYQNSLYRGQKRDETFDPISAYKAEMVMFNTFSVERKRVKRERMKRSFSKFTRM